MQVATGSNSVSVYFDKIPTICAKICSAIKTLNGGHEVATGNSSISVYCVKASSPHTSVPYIRAFTSSPSPCPTPSSFVHFDSFMSSAFPLSLPSLLCRSLPTLPRLSPVSCPLSSTVHESRQVLQEPDFTQLLLRDPNAPVVRKSRGTSTQGTSTHASSTHLAMLDEPPSASTSRAGSMRSKSSSFHGSLHRSRDGR